MVSLSDREVLSVKIWIIVIGVQIILFPIFLPPLSFLFLCCYSSYAPDQGLQDEANQERLGVEGTWINSKTKIIFEFIYVVLCCICGFFSYGYLFYEFANKKYTNGLIILLCPVTICWAYIVMFSALRQNKKSLPYFIYLNFIHPVGWIIMIGVVIWKLSCGRIKSKIDCKISEKKDNQDAVREEIAYRANKIKCEIRERTRRFSQELNEELKLSSREPENAFIADDDFDFAFRKTRTIEKKNKVFMQSRVYIDNPTFEVMV